MEIIIKWFATYAVFMCFYWVFFSRRFRKKNINL